MTVLGKRKDRVIVDKEQNRIYVPGRFWNKRRKVIDLADIIDVKQKNDTKVHIRKGKGSIWEGAAAGFRSGAGIIRGGWRRRGAEVIKGANYLTVTYLYQGKIRCFELDNILQPELYKEIDSMLKNNKSTGDLLIDEEG